jgi:hypothetical protein
METTPTNHADFTNGQAAQSEARPDETTTASAPHWQAGARARAVALALRVSIQTGRDAITTIGHGQEALDQAVHAVRRNNKNAAAALWLLEPWVAAETWARAEKSLRKASRLLREPRRAVALAHTLESLASDDDTARPAALEARLSNERQVSSELVAEVTRLLDDALAAVREFGQIEADDDAVVERVEAANRRLRRKTRAARGEESPKRLHALRKAVKLHAALHQALPQLTEPPPNLEELEALAAHLGKLNDLQDLQKHVKKSRAEMPKRERRSLKQRVQKRQAKEIRVSQKLARKLARKPRRLEESHVPEQHGPTTEAATLVDVTTGPATHSN